MPGRRHQSLRVGGHQLVEMMVHLVEKLWRETVFVVTEIEDGDLVFVGQADGHG
jgi:predicted SnoaL-like aldol condensation-catalyzing enzyme